MLHFIKDLIRYYVSGGLTWCLNIYSIGRFGPPQMPSILTYMFSVAVVTVQNPCLQVLYQTCHL